MNRKILKKVMAIILLVLIIISAYYSVSLATYSTINPAYIMDGAHEDSGATKGINNILGAILTVLQVIATGTAIIILIILAMKYIVASAGEKADIKKSAIPYLTGAIILFSGSAILAIIRRFAVKNVVLTEE